MNVNKYIEQAYKFFTSLAKEVVKELKPDHKMMAEHHKEMSMANFEASRAIVDEVSKASESIVSAINDKEVVDSVEIKNISELTDGIDGIIDTLRTELSKIDKEITVNNDLSGLTELFKSGKDKEGILKSLKRIEDKIKNPEITDYTLILNDLTTAVESIKIPEVDLSEVKKSLEDISSKLVFNVIPEETFTSDNRIRVELSEKQLQKIGGSTVVSGGGGTNLSGMIHNNIHTGSQEFRTYSEGHVCTNNSTTTPLGINGVFTGDWQDTLDYSEVIVSVYTDKSSVTNGLAVYWSADGVTIHGDDFFTISASSGKTFSFPCQNRYVKVVYTNDGVAQTYFVLQTLLKRFASKGSSHRLKDTQSQEDDAILTKSAIMGLSSQGGGTVVDVKVNPSGSLQVEASGTISTSEQDSPFIDAFGRKRVSNTGQRFDLEFMYSKRPELVDEVIVSGATATHNANSRDVTLAIVNTTTGTSASLYSHYDIPYTAGNSQLIDITGTLNDADIVGGSASLFIRSKVTGSVVETTYAQNAWNKNTASTVDWTKSQILQIDFQSLKVGRIRFNLVRGGLPVNIHEITNDNLRDGGYWQNPSLPIYWRIYNDANNTYAEMGYGDTDNGIGIRYTLTKNASATMRAICATVKSEGGNDLVDIQGMHRSIDNGTTTKTVSTTLIPLLSLQVAGTLNSLTNRMITLVEEIEVNTDNPIRYAVLYRPTLTNANFVAVDATYSGMNYDVSATAVSGGIVIDTGYVSSGVKASSQAQSGILGKTIMSLGRTGTSDIISLCAIRTGTSNANVLSAIKWKEIR